MSAGPGLFQMSRMSSRAPRMALPPAAGSQARQAPQARWLSATADDLYLVLGVGRTASQKEIKGSYMDLVKRHHPDRSSGGGSEADTKAAHDRFARITAAFDTLGDEFKRREYDRTVGTWARGSTYNNPGAGGRAYGYQKYEDIIRGNTNTGSQRTQDAGGNWSHDEFYVKTGRKGFQQQESPYKIFSDTTVVWLATLWMTVGALMHYWRFSESHEAQQEQTQAKNLSASNTLIKAQARAKENGTKLQLAMLRERRSMREAASSPAAE